MGTSSGWESQMRFTKVTLRVKADRTRHYEETFRRLRDRVLREEPGCKLFELCRDAEMPRTYHVLEAYIDDEAVAAHKATEYYEETARIFVECIEGDHMQQIKERNLQGFDMYSVVKGIEFERFSTI
jgi:(4S)-4-hydroxy-5-phosphonooxypentane-2,3-dione isomerase